MQELDCRIIWRHARHAAERGQCFALHGAQLRAGKLVQRTILGEQIVLGRTSSGKVFALRDNCPHRGVPLSEGHFDGELIQCCYHGWQFDCEGSCRNIPALSEAMANVGKIRAQSFPCEESNGTIWIYVPSKEAALPPPPLPDLLIPPGKTFSHVETVRLDADIDHATIGLIDPAHVTFVHRSWFWSGNRKPRPKQKDFEPVGKGFRMKRHQPSAKGSGKGYSLFSGEVSTEITFQLPGHRFEHIRVNECHEVISITLLTPVDENTTELNHIFYSSLPWVKYLWWPLVRLGRQFICQDVKVFRKLKRGLKSAPKLLLIGDPDAQARWYHELKKQWFLAKENPVDFINTLSPATLKWTT